MEAAANLERERRPPAFPLHQSDLPISSLYSWNAVYENLMSEAKPAKAAPAVELFGLNTPAKAALNKKNRDERRKAMQSQNARSRVK